MSAIPKPRKLTGQEYLAIEYAEFKSEFFDGEMFAMAGGRCPRTTRSRVNSKANCSCG
jgi:hypothetical protein